MTALGISPMKRRMSEREHYRQALLEASEETIKLSRILDCPELAWLSNALRISAGEVED